MSRYRLLTHYEIASLTEKKLRKQSGITSKKRKILAARIADSMHDISDYERSAVLTNHEKSVIDYGNKIRRIAEKNLQR